MIPAAILLGRKLCDEESEFEVTCLPHCESLSMPRACPIVYLELDRLLNMGSSNLFLLVDLALELSKLLLFELECALDAVIVCIL